MKIGRLKELINGLDDNMEIFIRNSHNVCGNIDDLVQVEKSSYGFFGESIDCIILNACNAVEHDDKGECEEFKEE